MLMAKETAATQGIRQTLARQLGEVLLHEITGNEYIPPDKDQSLGKQYILNLSKHICLL